MLSGPRRIGKSVVLLDTAAALCARTDVDARQVIHVPCDGMRDRDLRRVIVLGRELTRSVDLVDRRRRVWLLDEISDVPGWTATLKAGRDGTEFGDDTVIATGSRWLADEDVEGSLLTGRAGTSDARRVRQLLPMTFRDYLLCTRRELARFNAVSPWELQSATVGTVLDAFRFDAGHHDLAWQAYMSCGGFPRAVAEHTRTGQVSTSYLRDMAAWLRSDVDPEAPPDSVPLLIAALSQRGSSPLNVTGTAETLGYPNRQTLDRRLRRLTATFATLECPQRNDAGARVAGSQSKMYLTDPLLGWLPGRLRAGVTDPDMTVLTEMAIGVALARAVDALDEGRWVASDTIGYARTGGGKEVDLAPVVVPTPSGARLTVPVESKWIDTRWRNEAKVIEGKYSAGIVATKSLVDLDHPTWAVPAPFVALLLN